jgi:hypothetical protein
VHRQCTARAAQYDLFDFRISRQIGLAPGLAAVDEQIAFGTTAFADVNA